MHHKIIINKFGYFSGYLQFYPVKTANFKQNHSLTAGFDWFTVIN